MSTLLPNAESSSFRHDPVERLRHLLAGYLVIADPMPWPGGDCMTEEDVLHRYASLALRELAPDRVELCRRFPDLTQVIEEFFDQPPTGR